MSKLKNKFNRVGSDASQLQKFADEVCDNFSNEEGKWPDLSEGVGTKLYKHQILLNNSSETILSFISDDNTSFSRADTLKNYFDIKLKTDGNVYKVCAWSFGVGPQSYKKLYYFDTPVNSISPAIANPTLTAFDISSVGKDTITDI